MYQMKPLRNSIKIIQQYEKKSTPQMEEVSATAQRVSAAVQGVTVTTNEIANSAQGNAAASQEVAASSGGATSFDGRNFFIG